MASWQKQPGISPRVRRAVERTFQEGQREAVLRSLGRFAEDGADRIHLAILALADGDAREVAKLVRAAGEDWRDVLFWAETPDESGWDATRRQMAARYRRMGVPVPATLRGRR